MSLLNCMTLISCSMFSTEIEPSQRYFGWVHFFYHIQSFFFCWGAVTRKFIFNKIDAYGYVIIKPNINWSVLFIYLTIIIKWFITLLISTFCFAHFSHCTYWYYIITVIQRVNEKFFFLKQGKWKVIVYEITVQSQLQMFRLLHTHNLKI